MAINNAGIFVEGRDFQGDMNAVAFTMGRGAPDDTDLADDTRVSEVGLHTGRWEATGRFVGAADTEADAQLGQNNTIATIVLPALAVGNVAYVMRGPVLAHSQELEKGDIHRFTLSGVPGKAGGALVYPALRGILEHTGSESAGSGNTTGSQLGALSAGEKIAVITHIYASTGGASLSIDLEHDDNSGFTTALSDLTTVPGTALQGSWGEQDGDSDPTADTWWRAAWTVDVGTMSFAITLAKIS